MQHGRRAGAGRIAGGTRPSRLRTLRASVAHPAQGKRLDVATAAAAPRRILPRGAVYRPASRSHRSLIRAMPWRDAQARTRPSWRWCADVLTATAGQRASGSWRTCSSGSPVGIKDELCKSVTSRLCANPGRIRQRQLPAVVLVATEPGRLRPTRKVALGPNRRVLLCGRGPSAACLAR
jgi:hypothetical protein